FQSAVSYAVGTDSVAVAIGDVNGDGRPDLAVVDHGTSLVRPVDVGGVSVLLGNGDGTFAASFEYNAGQFPDCIGVGDFNGDGRLDLAVANEGGVSVLPNQPADAARFVFQAYQDLLHRAPDPNGSAYWTGLIGAGVPRTQDAC